jgi:hypothetical protein
VPAFIPALFDKENEIETIRRFIRQVAGYATVFGDGEEGTQQSVPMIDRVETILTSVGVAKGEYKGIFLKERVELGDLTRDELEEWVVGDVGGVIIPYEIFQNCK